MILTRSIPLALTFLIALGFPFPGGTASTNSTWRRPVMTWVPPYAVARSKARLMESFDGAGMKDALTYLGLQFWVPTPEGGIARTGRTNETSDAAIIELRDWGRTNGVRVLLCVYNGAKGWDWELARAGFADNPTKFSNALLAEVERLELDGVDIDLEGNGDLETDKAAFVKFIERLSSRLRTVGKHLTVDTFSYKWHAPNQTWWQELLPHVDGLTTMGYEQLGAEAQDWRSYEFQRNAAGKHASKLMIGLPASRNEWLGTRLLEHLQWLKKDGAVGVSFWDAQLRAEAWRTAEVWKILGEIRQGGGHRNTRLKLKRDHHWLVIQGDHLPQGEIRINYLEAYCRAGSTDADWVKHTVIPHRNTFISAEETVMKLRDTLEDGVTVEHTITVGQDEVNFRLVAHNPTDRVSEVQWAQPCVRLGGFTGFDSDHSRGNIDDYLPRCFIFLDGRLTRMPTPDWESKARYVPGQVWCPAHVRRTDVNPRPLNPRVPSNGLIGCFSGDNSLIFATAWEPYQELFQGVARCLHSDFRVGGLYPGETKTIRGKIYVVDSDVSALLARYAADFPEHVR